MHIHAMYRNGISYAVVLNWSSELCEYSMRVETEDGNVLYSSVNEPKVKRNIETYLIRIESLDLEIDDMRIRAWKNMSCD